MPRANRYILPSQIYHVTHRCHNREYLLRFAIDRNSYRDRLREGVARYRASVLGYCITSNHVHLLLYSRKTGSVSRLMQYTQGCAAQDYNRRKNRKGAFWENRYHCTMIGNGRYMWTCLAYIDFNMVRAGVVSSPREWQWCSFQEINGLRQRYRLLDLQIFSELAGGYDVNTFRNKYNNVLKEYATAGRLLRDPQWTESIAVGDKAFVESFNLKNA